MIIGLLKVIVGVEDVCLDDCGEFIVVFLVVIEVYFVV